MKRYLSIAVLVLCLASLAILGTRVVAQSPLTPSVVNAQITDIFADVVSGYPTAGNKYASAAQIASVENYKDGLTITTDPAYTFVNGQVLYTAHKASTLTTGTFTTEPNPTDGKRECVVIDQTTSTLTWTANTNQTIGASVATAGTAHVPSCILYDASTSTWVGSN